MAELARRQVVERGSDVTPRHRRLHARRHRAAGRDERLELVADLDERVRHRDDDLAVQLLLERMRGRRRAVPRRREHDDVGARGALVVGRVDVQVVVGPLGEDAVDGLHGPVLRPRAQCDVVSDRRQPGAESRACGTGAAEDADPHRLSLAHQALDPGAGGNVAAASTVGGTMGLLEGKRIVVTGVLTDASLAFGVAQLAQQEGAEVVLTGAGRGLSLTERTARKLPSPAPVLELDVTVPEHLDAVRDDLAERWGRVDGVLHAIGFAPAVCFGGNFLEATWEDVSVALQVSSYSFKALADCFVPLMTEGGSLVGLDFDASVAWPAYDWMGVAKAALESTSRYLARELGGEEHPGQPRRRRTDPHDGSKVDPGLLAVRGRVGRARTARLGHQRLDRGGEGMRGVAVGLVPRDDRGDRPRRRRLPRDRRVTPMPLPADLHR